MKSDPRSYTACNAREGDRGMSIDECTKPSREPDGLVAVSAHWRTSAKADPEIFGAMPQPEYAGITVPQSVNSGLL